MVRVVGRENALWQRPIFKAPPLERHLKPLDAKAVARELRRIGMIRR